MDANWTYEVLPGLPATGDRPLQFSATGMGMHSEGFVVRFTHGASDSWVGNFQPGLSRFSGVFRHPDGRTFFVVSSGQVYRIDPQSHEVLDLYGGGIDCAISSPDGRLLLFSDATSVDAFSREGLLWASDRIAWDGIRDLTFDSDMISGEAYDVMTDHWIRFEIDPASGKHQGGAYDATPIKER
jgi:hypothetical protein